MRNCTIVLALFAAFVLALGTSAQAELVGYWNFDNSGNRYEESSGWAQSAKGLAAGHYDAENAVGTPVWSSTNGIIGTYLDLSDAQDDALRVKNSASWPIPSEGATFGFGHGTAEPQTVTVWVKGWPDADDETFVGYRPLGQGNHGYSLRRGTATLAEYTYGGRVIQGNASVTLADGEWHHLAGVVDTALGGSAVKLYVDGKLAANNSLGDKWDYEPDYLLFGAMSNNNVLSGFSNVLLDDIGVWHGSSSPKEIAAMHAMGLFEGIGLNDAGVANLIAAFDAGSGNSTTINTNVWAHTTGLTGPMGNTGGTAGSDAWVVLDGNGAGMQITAAPGAVIPEPSTFAIWALGLLALAFYGRRRRSKQPTGQPRTAPTRLNTTDSLFRSHSKQGNDSMRNCTILLALFAALVLALGTPARGDLTGYWNFDNDDLVESSGYIDPAGSHDGTGVGTVAYMAGPTGFGRAIDLTGGGGVNVNNSSSGSVYNLGHVGGDPTLANSPLTVACWVNAWPDADRTEGWDNWWGSFVDKQGAGNGGWKIGAESATLAEYWLGDTRGPQGNAGVNVSDGEWHHIAATFDNSTTTPQLKLYVDGGVAATGDFSTLWDHNIQLRFGVQNVNGEAYSLVQLDEIRVYNEVLDQNAIQALMTAPAGPVIPEPSTLLIWALGLLGLAGWMRLRKK